MSDIRVSISGNEGASAVIGTGSNISVSIAGGDGISSRVGGDAPLRVQEERNREFQTKIQPDCCDNIDGGTY